MTAAGFLAFGGLLFAAGRVLAIGGIWLLMDGWAYTGIPARRLKPDSLAVVRPTRPQRHEQISTWSLGNPSGRVGQGRGSAVEFCVVEADDRPR